MKKTSEKKQNNRALDEKRKPELKKDNAETNKSWDPDDAANSKKR